MAKNDKAAQAAAAADEAAGKAADQADSGPGDGAGEQPPAEGETDAKAGKAKKVRIPEGFVPLSAPAGVTAVSGGVFDGARFWVAPAIAEALIRMHGFSRG